MPTKSVHVTMTAQEAGVVQAWMNIRRQGPEAYMKAIERANQAAAGGSRKAGQQIGFMGAQLRAIGAGLMRMYLGWQSVHRAIQLAVGEVENYKQIMRDAAEQQVDTGRAAAQFIQSLPQGADISADEAMKIVMSARGGEVSPAQRIGILAAMQQKAPSAMGLRGRAELARDFINLTRYWDQETREELAGSAEFLTRAFTDRARGGTGLEQLGTIMSAWSVSPSGGPQLKEFVQNVVGATPSLKQFGLDLKESLALLTAIQNRSFDTTGEVTKTTAINVMKTFREAAAEVGRTDLQGMQLVQWLQSDDEQARRARLQLRGVMEYEIQETARRQGVTVAQLLAGQGITDMTPDVGARAKQYMTVMELLAGPREIAEKQARGELAPGETVQELMAEAEASIVQGKRAEDWLREKNEEIARSSLTRPLQVRGIVRQGEQRLLGAERAGVIAELVAGAKRTEQIVGGGRFSAEAVENLLYARAGAGATAEELVGVFVERLDRLSKPQPEQGRTWAGFLSEAMAEQIALPGWGLATAGVPALQQLFQVLEPYTSGMLDASGKQGDELSRQTEILQQMADDFRALKERLPGARQAAQPQPPDPAR